MHLNYNAQFSSSLNVSYMHTNSFSTWLSFHRQNGFAIFIFVVLEVNHAVILIFVWAIHRISGMETCRSKKKQQQGNEMILSFNKSNTMTEYLSVNNILWHQTPHTTLKDILLIWSTAEKQQ